MIRDLVVAFTPSLERWNVLTPDTSQKLTCQWKTPPFEDAFNLLKMVIFQCHGLVFRGVPFRGKPSCPLEKEKNTKVCRSIDHKLKMHFLSI